MTKLYLVRHGETFDNERQIMQGQTPGELWQSLINCLLLPRPCSGNVTGGVLQGVLSLI